MDRLFTDKELANKVNAANSINFMIKGEAIIELRENGDIYIKGKLVENDKDVVEALRDFLRSQKYDI